MLFETSIQAQFLVPMAVSLATGIVFASVIILFLVPALLMIREDFRWFGRSGAEARRGHGGVLAEGVPAGPPSGTRSG